MTWVGQVMSAVAAALSPASGSAPRPLTPTVAGSGPAANTGPTPSDGIKTRIIARADRLRFANDVQRQRFIETTLTLASKVCCEVRE